MAIPGGMCMHSQIYGKNLRKQTSIKADDSIAMGLDSRRLDFYCCNSSRSGYLIKLEQLALVCFPCFL